MKTTLLGLLLIMTFVFTGCGGKDNKSGDDAYSGSNPFSSSNGAPVTRNGYLNLQTQALEVGSMSYPPQQQYAPIVNQAIMQAQYSNVKPIQHNGAWKLRARITGYDYNSYQQQPYQNGYNYGNTYSYPQYNQNQYGYQGTFQLQNIIFVNSF